MTTKPEWARLARELEAPIGTQTTYQTSREAAAELRRLGQENTKQAEQLKAVTHLVTQLHKAKGHYRDRAMLSLFEAFGLTDKPEKTK